MLCTVRNCRTRDNHSRTSTTTAANITVWYRSTSTTTAAHYASRNLHNHAACDRDDDASTTCDDRDDDASTNYDASTNNAASHRDHYASGHPDNHALCDNAGN